MQGARKLILCGMGLGSLLALGALTAYGGLPVEAASSLNWGIVMLTGTGLGANVGEWAMKRTPAAKTG